jgi:hypothetical protein
MLVMPSLWTSEKSVLKTEARHMSSTLRYIHDEAVGKKQPYVFHVNFKNKTWGFKSKKETRSFNIRKGAQIKDIVVPSLGVISRGEVSVVFGPNGSEEPMILHLINADMEYTVTFNNISGRTKVLEGYTL